MRGTARGAATTSAPVGWMRRVSSMLRDEHGGVAAEFAVTLPAVLLVLAAAIGTLNAQAQHILLLDATADAARLVARGDDAQRAARFVSHAVADARLDVRLDDEVVCATGSTTASILPGIRVEITASACALGDG